MTTSCREVLTRRNEHPNTRHPSEYVSFVVSVTNASRFSERNCVNLMKQSPTNLLPIALRQP